MKLITFCLMMFLLWSCATEKPKFEKEKVCTNESLKYLRNPRNISKRAVHNPKLIQAVASSARSMQLCYEDFKNRTGLEEFNTCLVVGVDEAGSLDFYNFGSQEKDLDTTFIKCAQDVTKRIPYSSFGNNYILIQSYQFFVDGSY